MTLSALGGELELCDERLLLLLPQLAPVVAYNAVGPIVPFGEWVARLPRPIAGFVPARAGRLGPAV